MAKGCCCASDVRVFDYWMGLERYGGLVDSYHQALRTFTDQTPPILERLDGAALADHGIYLVLIRAMRAYCESISATRHTAMAVVLESAVQEGRRGVIEEEHHAFVMLSYVLCIEVRETLRLQPWKKGFGNRHGIAICHLPN